MVDYLLRLEFPSHKDIIIAPSLFEISQMVLKKIFLYVNVFSVFRYYLPLEKGRALHLKELESHSPKDALCRVWLILEKILKNFVFSLSRFYFPVEKGGALHLNKLKSPSPKNALCQVWLKLIQWFWRRRWKCEKFTHKQTNRRTDRRTTGKLTSFFGSGELKVDALLFFLLLLLLFCGTV